MSRFWVPGGTATWLRTTDGNNWSASSGGAGGASAPDASTDAIFDGNSGSDTVSIDGSEGPARCAALDTSAFAGGFDFNNGDLEVSGNLTSGGTVIYQNFTAARGIFILTACTITSNGADLGRITISSAVAFTVTLADALTLSVTSTTRSALHMVNFDGTFDANDKNVTIASLFASDVAGGLTIKFGSGTWTVTHSNSSTPNTKVFQIIETVGITIIPSTSIIKFTDASSTAKTFSVTVTSATFRNVWFSGSGTGNFVFDTSGPLTFTDIKVDTPPHTVIFTAGATYIVSSFTVSGTAGNLMTIRSDSGGTPFTLSKSSGTVTCDYMSITDSTATGGASWLATHSVDGGGNSGWNFGAINLIGFGHAIPFA